MTPEYKPIEELESFVVLVADDDAMVRCILVEYLKNFGFKHIEQAKNGMEALKYIRDHKKPLDLIVSDWEMPKMDGHVLLKAVRNDPLRFGTKFIMVTSQASQERFKITRAKQLSVDGYIIKPFHGDILRQKVLQVMGIKDPYSHGGDDENNDPFGGFTKAS